MKPLHAKLCLALAALALPLAASADALISERQISTDAAIEMAQSALTYNLSSREYGKNAAGNPGSAGTLHLANITTAAGGLPIRAGDTLVGAIGISGTPGAKGGGAADEECAKTAIEKIAGGLAK